ncbi:MAG: hydrogenase formation protein HypD [Armatimonadota bacterium]
MKYKDEFAGSGLAKKLIDKINEINPGTDLNFMEVCGTHTMSIAKYGIKSVLPENIHLLSGPGCPVCVTGNKDIDLIVEYARCDDVVIATFGDMFKVPGSYSSLAKEKANGRDIRIVYSAVDAIDIAMKNPDKKVVFMGIGFETTAPTIAAAILEAERQNINNFYILSAFKVVPDVLEILVNDPQLKLDGLICPGHLSTITGTRIYEPLVGKYNIPCVVTGFEPLDVLQGIYMLIKQNVEGTPKVENQYKRAVPHDGNKIAMDMLDKVFEISSSNWRGIGDIPKSGLKLREKYKEFDIERIMPVKIDEVQENPGCICGFILRGIKTPKDCGLFKEVCNPENPVGACMVSSEGTCAAYYKYNQ